VKSFRKELWFNIPERRAFVNITPQIQEALRESGIQEGFCLVNAMNITSRIRINDAAGSETGSIVARARMIRTRA
jgi:thiamine phosphate synthase YjbQ (UPF0047 family)